MILLDFASTWILNLSIWFKSKIVLKGEEKWSFTQGIIQIYHAADVAF